MATVMNKDEKSVDCLVSCHHDHDRKISAKSVTIGATTLCKNLSGYRELLINVCHSPRHYFCNSFKN